LFADKGSAGNTELGCYLGIASVGGVAVGIALTVLANWCWKRRRNSQSEPLLNDNGAVPGR